MTEPLYIDEREVARRTSLARITLRTWRSRGEGPPFHKIGRRVLYRWADVEQWIEARKVG